MERIRAKIALAFILLAITAILLGCQNGTSDLYGANTSSLNYGNNTGSYNQNGTGTAIGGNVDSNYDGEGQATANTTRNDNTRITGNVVGDEAYNSNRVIGNNETFREFTVKYTRSNRSDYELAEDDIFNRTQGNVTSDRISVLGIMLGDSYRSVLDNLGTPDYTYQAPNGTYKELEYQKMIGIGQSPIPLSVRIENNSVAGITVRQSFNKYLQGSTKLGTAVGTLYSRMSSTPDYQDTVEGRRTLHFSRQGFSIGLNQDNSAASVLTLVWPANRIRYSGTAGASVRYGSSNVSTSTGYTSYRNTSYSSSGMNSSDYDNGTFSGDYIVSGPSRIIFIDENDTVVSDTASNDTVSSTDNSTLDENDNTTGNETGDTGVV